MVATLSLDELSRTANVLRREVAEVLHACGGGHYGGVLSVLDIILAIYSTQLRGVDRGTRHPDRDRFILSKGHAALALYAVLRHFRLVDGDLARYGALSSPFAGHPDSESMAAVDFSTGSLGQGLSVGLGMAVALKSRAHVWVVLGDGECQEGQVWEAAMLAARLAVDNLKAIVDANGFQEWGWSRNLADATPPVSDQAQKWRAFGWSVIDTDGHDFDQLTRALSEAASTPGPTVVLARTRKGKGFAMAEEDPIRFHCTTLDANEHARFLQSVR